MPNQNTASNWSHIKKIRYATTCKSTHLKIIGKQNNKDTTTDVSLLNKTEAKSQMQAQ